MTVTINHFICRKIKNIKIINIDRNEDQSFLQNKENGKWQLCVIYTPHNNAHRANNISLSNPQMQSKDDNNILRMENEI